MLNNTPAVNACIPALEQALQLAQEFPVFPCRPADEVVGDRTYTAKSPYNKNGFLAASTDAGRVAAWWERWPDALIGVPTGKVTGLLIVDVDPDGAPWYTENAVRLACGRIHSTPRGHHLAFHMPDADVRCSASVVAPGVDIRANGGYVIWWPAHGQHRIGGLDDLTAPPAWLLDMIVAAKPAATVKSNGAAHATGPVESISGPVESIRTTHGGRHDKMKTLAAKWRHKGLAPAEILPLLWDHSARFFDPPHSPDDASDRDELEAMANWFDGKAAGNGHDTQPWEPPAVISYGASFDPAKIPLRQWLIRGRYARGEGTALVGPPGTNKSSLLLTDAVALATGRSLLGDTIDEAGGVLLLVGEDRKRDVEARIAALCVQYQIQPAELREQLHVVYQSAIDPNQYTLATMVRDIATLNTSMIEWLRLFPGLVALFVDPMASWHRLFENDNNAMTMLCLALRSIAEQSNIGVAFDHHVNKASMADPEAHVQNLAALRGSSSIAADMRWGFTLARLRPETAAQFGIPEDECRPYRRLDSLKASYGPDNETMRLLKVNTVQIANGEHVGVLATVDTAALRFAGLELKEVAAKRRQSAIADALGRMLLNKRPRSGAEAARWIATHEADLFVDEKGVPLADRTVRRKLEGTVGAGLPWKHSGGDVSIIVRVTGERNGTRQEFDFQDAQSTSGQGSGR